MPAQPESPPYPPTLLETERLIVRPYRAGDGPAYQRLCLNNKAHLLPYEEGNPALEVSTLEEAEALVRSFAASWAARSAFFLGAWTRDGGELVAQVHVGVVGWDLPELEIGYFVDVDHQSRGYVTEAVYAALSFAFDHLGAERVRLACDEMNVRSWRVAERCEDPRLALGGALRPAVVSRRPRRGRRGGPRPG